ncbi:MAG: hypothetical protein PHG19_04765 [Anaerotignum sp.]|nr:hypothetical protein [Anaerotignum sp.]
MKFDSLKIATLLTVVFLAITFCLFRNIEFFVLCEKGLSNYFDSERISFLISFFSVVIAMYITMTSILAISTTKIMEALLEKCLEKKFLSVIKWSLTSSIFSALVCVFLNKYFISYGFLLLLSISFAVAHLIYFIRLLFTIFEYNINNMDKELDEYNKLRQELKITLKYIREEINKKN